MRNGERRKIRQKSDDKLMQEYYRILRDLGPDPVLEERIEREEHRMETAGSGGRKSG